MPATWKVMCFYCLHKPCFNITYLLRLKALPDPLNTEAENKFITFAAEQQPPSCLQQLPGIRITFRLFHKTL